MFLIKIAGLTVCWRCTRYKVVLLIIFFYFLPPRRRLQTGPGHAHALFSCWEQGIEDNLVRACLFKVPEGAKSITLIQVGKWVGRWVRGIIPRCRVEREDCPRRVNRRQAGRQARRSRSTYLLCTSIGLAPASKKRLVMHTNSSFRRH